MPDTPVQTPSIDESDLATLQSTNTRPTALLRWQGVISCVSPTSNRSLEFPERRKKFRKARLDFDENVTIQVADTQKLKEEANNLLRGQYEARGYDTTFLGDEDTASEIRLLTLLVKQGARASGTCSLLLDLPGHHLRADLDHLDCLNDLRNQGKYLIEIVQLAAAEITNSTDRISLAALFSYIALCLNSFLDYKPFLVVEVATRHIDYWSSLGFVVLKDATWCDRVNTASALLVCDWVRLWQLIKIEWQNPVRGSQLSNRVPIAIRRFVRHFMPWEDVEGIMHRMTLSQKKEQPTLISNCG
jgi:hypothetical protein